MLWTMFIELFASAFMPVIRAAQQRGARWILALVVALSVLGFLVQNHTKQVSVYLVTFAIGGTVPYLSSAVTRLCARPRRAESLSLVASVVVLLWFRELIPHERWQSFDPLIVQVEALAAMWIVALAVHRPHGYPSLRHRALVRLGDISYGLYLLHFPILLAAVPAAERILPADVDRTALGFGMAVAVSIATVIASTACYAAVEMPAVTLGARLARLARRRLAATARPGTELARGQ